MTSLSASTLRLIIPQWQGGNVHDYYFGSQLLAWLAPAAGGPVEVVPVPEPRPGETLEIERGLLARRAVVEQAKSARQLIEKHKPSKVVTLGGDCLIDLAPMAYLFTPNNIEPSKCFKTVRAGSHQANAFSVASGVLDVATNNTVGVLFFQRQSPEQAAKIEVIWTSPPLPESSIVVRKDMDPALKEKIRQFFLTYGTGSDEKAAKQREVLKGLAYGGFRPADNSYLNPVREMEAAEALAAARRSGDAAKISKAQAEFDKVRAEAAQARAIEPTAAP